MFRPVKRSHCCAPTFPVFQLTEFCPDGTKITVSPLFTGLITILNTVMNFKMETFEMTSNGSNVYLKIKQVDLSDSGLYFCGFFLDGHILINIKLLNVQEDPDGITKLTSVILGGLTVFLLMVIIGLVVKIRKLQTGWISVSASESQTVDVQSGQEVTLLCSNFSSVHTHIFWFKLVNKRHPHCVAQMFMPLKPATFCPGFQNEKFEMQSNISTVFLKIKQVDLSDSGLYFCGYYVSGDPVIVDATYLEVQEFDGVKNLMSVTLAALTVFLVMVVICLAGKIKKPQKADNEEENPQWREGYSTGSVPDTVCLLFPVMTCGKKLFLFLDPLTGADRHKFDGVKNLMSVTLAALTVFLVMVVICLAGKIKKLQNGWISVSASESQTVDVQSGQEVTLLCSNFSTVPTQIFWFTLVNRTHPHCISHMYEPLQPATFCPGFQNRKFEIRSNISTVFLKIKQVDLSDSGLYFCGYYISGDPVIVEATYLEVQEFDGVKNLMSVTLAALTVFLVMVVICLAGKIKKLQNEDPDGITKLTSVILGGLTVFLLMVIIGLVVKIRKLQTAQCQEPSPQTQNLDSDDLNYAALRFLPNPNLRPASERELETNVVYAATR
ncbi:hypothetical protein GBF38_000347 [Nibea albiflora]|nr:hypothetical protein GBF38_000347 [Nibea albiflora]